MKKNKIINVVLSGGSGTRLWPLSRASKPKQFLKIFDKKSLFQHTVKRNSNIVDEYMIITNSLQIVEAEEQSKDIGFSISKKIIEPIGRNTAPAIALAAFDLKGDDIMIVTPSDHMINNPNSYEKAMKRAIELAEEDYLVTFGITPTSPNTGFGYIEYENEEVLSFREKPDFKTAEEFLKKGNFSWNSGIFCFKASVFLQELEKYNVEMYLACVEAYKTIENGLIDLGAMKNIPADSIDYAVLEKSKKIKTISSNFYWTDLGTFDSIINYFEESNQVDGLSKTEDESGFNFSKKKVFSSIDNLIIVDTDDCLLVLKRNETDAVKEIYNKIKIENIELTE
ncbi:mannose-1-phosphate guanylyltransferase [Tenacibaculum adriaticum]|uniref:Mannose-1-phosphate guanylyltransferase n=1 Tax=Tenacibaculum adriaticum TaxID=413713 RepID=A0A5S5DN90_9FLAO|nr:sugar phosphate nucleotidyltransferase [Tenacibaculum adriaticum]TYP97341.1 mannose-1-phosphate guanylyltransferase [Tenacibaculum adriaticum]